MNRKPSRAIRALLADNVVRLRKARGLTQTRLAAACGVRVGYIGDIERAAVNVTLASLEVLTIGLECAPADLLIRVQGATPPNIRRSPGGSAV
jgi:transcriptional regulator with XRE-family HTH domain